jgi:hypothetical protein
LLSFAPYGYIYWQTKPITFVFLESLLVDRGEPRHLARIAVVTSAAKFRLHAQYAPLFRHPQDTCRCRIRRRTYERTGSALPNPIPQIQKEIAKMKSLRIALALFLSFAATTAFAQTSAQKSFDQLKSLAGSWEGKDSKGRSLRVSFRDIARGSTLMSEIQKEGHDGVMFSMISMIHLDGPNRLLLTHYCSDGNQPRMAATPSPDGKTITFNFFDATNVTTPDATYARRLIFTIVDANHHTEDWTFAAGPGKEIKEFFDLQRTEVAKK